MPQKKEIYVGPVVVAVVVMVVVVVVVVVVMVVVVCGGGGGGGGSLVTVFRPEVLFKTILRSSKLHVCMVWSGMKHY